MKGPDRETNVVFDECEEEYRPGNWSYRHGSSTGDVTVTYVSVEGGTYNLRCVFECNI